MCVCLCVCVCVCVCRGVGTSREAGRQGYLLKPLNVLDQEAVGIVPGQEDVLQDVTNAVFFESQVLCPHHRRIDQVEPGGDVGKGVGWGGGGDQRSVGRM